MVPTETPTHAPDAKREIEAALDWWRQAGLTADFQDEHSVWLDAETAKPVTDVTEPSAQQPVIRKKTPPPVKPVGGERITVAKAVPMAGSPEEWPTELAAFQDWWAGKKDDGSDGEGSGPTPHRIPARGTAGANHLFLVPQPEAEDRERLLDGPRGAMLVAMQRAMGLGETDCYIASALPTHALQPDWDELVASGHGAIVRHHLGLAAPERIIVFGRRILPLVAHEPAQDAANLRSFNHEGRSVPLLAAPELGSLLRSASQRKRFWQQWLEWTD
ncbi:hypothetical protein ACFCW2_11620 [Qipengyuania sp. DSG2-2]|uniref:hypothetical protein n=1 Tax=Qipengyuania sp. DGS2-2 TaxID=3349631 RepID=UPI0036D4367E